MITAPLAPRFGRYESRSMFRPIHVQYGQTRPKMEVIVLLPGFLLIFRPNVFQKTQPVDRIECAKAHFVIPARYFSAVVETIQKALALGPIYLLGSEIALCSEAPTRRGNSFRGSRNSALNHRHVATHGTRVASLRLAPHAKQRRPHTCLHTGVSFVASTQR